jgi:hypothetical protein
MATLTGPLLSFGASGQIAKTQVYSTWKGRAYARRLVIPSNPRSTEQTKTRTAFTFLNNVFRIAPGDLIAPWTQFAKGKVLFNRNAWIQKNLPIIRDELSLDGLLFSPGASGGLTVTPLVVGGAGSITVTADAPAPLPAGWTIVKFVAVAILEQNPHLDTDYQVFSGSDLTSTYSVVLSSLDPGDYQVGAWFVYQRSALLTDLAYGASVAQVETVT